MAARRHDSRFMPGFLQDLTSRKRSEKPSPNGDGRKFKNGGELVLSGVNISGLPAVRTVTFEMKSIGMQANRSVARKRQIFNFFAYLVKFENY